MKDNSDLVNCYEDEILEYISSIGIRAENNKGNKAVYTVLTKIIYNMCKNSSIEEVYSDYLHFIDCVANNILGVKIYERPYEGTPRTNELKYIYNNLKILHEKISI